MSNGQLVYWYYVKTDKIAVSLSPPVGGSKTRRSFYKYFRHPSTSSGCEIRVRAKQTTIQKEMNINKMINGLITFNANKN